MRIRALLAEFIGTFAIVFIGVGAIVADHSTNGAVGLTGIGLAFGGVVAAMATATSAVSGGHLNPAVSLGMLITGNMSFKECLSYIIVQCLGGIVASSMLMSAISPLSLDAVNYGLPIVGESATAGMACITEIVLTFLLVITIFGTIADRRSPKVGGLFAGLAVMVAVIVGGPISGAALNPARWLGPAVISGDYADAWIYWVGPVAGSVLASIVYTMFMQEKEKAAS